ncbi:MMPL family transporter [bacterium]|nr:MMPL family transporter [bacterium]
MFKRLYSKFVDFSVAKPWWIIGGAFLLTLFFIWQAGQLKLAMTWMDMMPQKEAFVKEYRHLVKTFGTTDMIMVVVEAPTEEDVIAMTEETAARLKTLGKWVKRIDYTVDLDFIRKHGLMLSKAKDLKRMQSMLADPNLLPWLTALNDDFEREYIEDSGNMKKDEAQIASQINALGVLADTLSRLSNTGNVLDGDMEMLVERLTIGEKYFLSSDRKMAMLIIAPTFTADDTDLAYAGVLDMQAVIDTLKQENAGIWIGLTGMSVIMKDEMKTAQEDSMILTLGALLIITALFIITFRMWTAPLLAMLILVIGIIWDYGLAGLLIGKLTMFSAMSAVLLIGLGVDYLMHFLSSFFEARVEGKGAHAAIMYVYRTSGRGIVLGAITTSLVFFSMILSDFPAMVEFGVTMGLGILACMFVTLVLLPAIMVLRERHLQKKVARGKNVTPFSAQFTFLNQSAAVAYNRPWRTIIVVLIATALMLWGVSKLKFDHNFLNVEAKGLESVELYDIMEERFDLSADALMFTTDSLEAAEKKMYALDDLTTVGQADSLARYLPSEKSQSQRKPYVDSIYNTVKQTNYAVRMNTMEFAKQIERLSDNIVEIGQLAYLSGLTKVTKQCDFITGLDTEGNQKNINRLKKAAKNIRQVDKQNLSGLSQSFFKHMKNTITSMANSNSISLEEIRPDTRDRFLSSDEKLYAVQAYSRKNVYKHMNDTSFIDDVQLIAPQATGMPTIFKELIAISSEKGKMALIIASIVIVVLLLITFRSVEHTLLALIPVVFGYIFMFGTMGWIGMPLSIVSVMMLPLIVGIGIDDGIHLVNRYRIEGPGSQPVVVASTGKAIFLTTATTMLGFGSLITAKYQGFGHMGWITVFGVSWCFIISITLIPAILKLIERRKRS